MAKRMKKWIMVSVKVLVVIAVLGLLGFNGYVFRFLRWKMSAQGDAIRSALKDITKIAVEQKVASFTMEYDGKSEQVLCTLPRFVQQPEKAPESIVEPKGITE